jgi:hypothetical protein
LFFCYFSFLIPFRNGLWSHCSCFEIFCGLNLVQVTKDKARYAKEMKTYKPPPGFEAPATKGKGKTKKDPNAPKRGQSAYFHFMNEMRPKVKEETPDINFGDIGKVIGEKWKVISAEEKARYEAMANKDKERYTRELKTYNAKKKASDDDADGIDDDQDEDDSDADSS